MQIRDARPREMAEVGEVRVAAYVADGFLSPDSGYTPVLRDLGADGTGEVLVAVRAGLAAPGQAPGTQDADGSRPAAAGERIVGTIMLCAWPHAGRTVTSPDEAEIRALAVRPDERGDGIGALLLSRVIERARQTGVRHLVLCTEPEMKAAHRLYERAGFLRLRDRDWSPGPRVTLLVYGLRLA